MSTRGVITVCDPGTEERFNIYKHHDMYPSGMLDHLEIVVGSSYIWPLPRFEADEFAAGFIAACKGGPGGLRLLQAGNWRDVAPFDIDYQYTVTFLNGQMIIHGNFVEYDKQTGEWEVDPFFTGSLEDLRKYVKQEAA